MNIIFKKLLNGIAGEINDKKSFNEAYNISFNSNRNIITDELYSHLFENITQNARISDNVFILNSLNEVIDILYNIDACYLVDRCAFGSFVNNYPKLKNAHNIIYIDSIKSGIDLRNIVENFKNNILVGVGGGRTFDILKFISNKTNCKMIAIPTSLTTHVYASKKIHALPQIKEFGYELTIDGEEPHITFVDKSFLIKLEIQNKKLIYSGFGDIMAFINAKHDWFLAISRNENSYNEIADYFIEYVIEQLKLINVHDNFEVWLEKYVLIQVILCNITHWAGSAPASGAEHLFAKCIEDETSELPLHGEIVALGVLIFSYIRNKDIDEVNFLLKKFKISNSFSNLNLNKSLIINALTKSFNEGIRKNRYTILNELNCSFSFFKETINVMIDKKLLQE